MATMSSRNCRGIQQPTSSDDKDSDDDYNSDDNNGDDGHDSNGDGSGYGGNDCSSKKNNIHDIELLLIMLADCCVQHCQGRGTMEAVG